MKQGCNITGNRTRVLAQSKADSISTYYYCYHYFHHHHLCQPRFYHHHHHHFRALVLYTSSRQQSKIHANVPKFSLSWSNLFNLINLPEVSQVFPDAELLKSATFLQTWFHQNLCRSSWIQTMYGYLIFLTQSSWKAVLFVYYPLHLLQKCSFFRNCIKMFYCYTTAYTNRKKVLPKK